ncbi:hypothetical protein [Tropicibacter sp. S64]|uniref:hypothetical protein n=1 Tax=Tropicibacter sp. S64 TaxID=3415122 RepID=UPI003C7EAB0F
MAGRARAQAIRPRVKPGAALRLVAQCLPLLALSACLTAEAVPEIPAALQGRWGLVAADCEPGRDDAKGLMTVGESTLTFYESRATLDRLSERGETQVQGSFAFTGEGMAWERLVSLTLNEDGTLTRSEIGDAPDADSYTYLPCP